MRATGPPAWANGVRTPARIQQDVVMAMTALPGAWLEEGHPARGATLPQPRRVGQAREPWPRLRRCRGRGRANPDERTTRTATDSRHPDPLPQFVADERRRQRASAQHG